ncbi:hypothetical protein VNN38_08665 [Lactococcus petauri]|uniref:Transposase n=1 Tax=Lactococcus petauri TaxID=1940789 RepID=A0ABZ2SF80_9LACT
MEKELKDLKAILKYKKAQKRKLKNKVIPFYMHQYELKRYCRSSGLHKFLFSEPRTVPFPYKTLAQLEALEEEIVLLELEIEILEPNKCSEKKLSRIWRLFT